jgi:hypothetical protein
MSICRRKGLLQCGVSRKWCGEHMNRFATLLALGCGLVLPAGQALAQDGRGMRQMLGAIGLVEPERDPIDYKARPPLVVPPSMALRTPSAGSAAETNPNWPKDPDVEARKAADAEARKPATEREKYILGQRPLLSQEELRKGRINAPPITVPTRSAMDQSPYEVMQEPIIIGRELAAQKAAREDPRFLSREEPKRRYLSDPPVGIRAPAAGAELVKPPSDGPRPMQSRFGQQEFIAEQARRGALPDGLEFAGSPPR